MPLIQIQTKQLITYHQWITVTDDELEVLKEQTDNDIYEKYDGEAYNILDGKIDFGNILESDECFQDFKIIEPPKE